MAVGYALRSCWKVSMFELLHGLSQDLSHHQYQRTDRKVKVLKRSFYVWFAFCKKRLHFYIHWGVKKNPAFLLSHLNLIWKKILQVFNLLYLLILPNFLKHFFPLDKSHDKIFVVLENIYKIIREKREHYKSW